jgi:ADP-heptose:LPS heptosyltransferase/GT2 family glycosyltransferase
MEALFSDYEEIRKSGLFDAQYYLATYPDVAARNVDPLVHYLEEGGREGRNPHPDFDGAFYLEQCEARGERPGNPLLHYLRIGAARGFTPRRGAADRQARAGSRPRPAGPPRKPPRKQPILVAIESLGVVGMPDGTSRLSLSGWALAAAPIAEITASVNGQVIATATYGLARPDVASLYPDTPEAARSGLLLACDLPDPHGEAITPVLTVRTADGEIGHHPLRFEVPPQELDVGVVDPLDPAVTARKESGLLHMQLYIDSASVDRSGLLRLDGWVVCLVQIEAVEAFIDGTLIGKAEFGRVRTDIEKAHPDYPNARFSGFRLIADIGMHGSGQKTVTIVVAARSGITGQATVDVQIPAHLALSRATPEIGFHYHLDDVTLTTAGQVALKGWIVCPSPLAAILVLLDGEPIGRAELGVERADVGNLFAGLPHARQPGFRFAAATGKPCEGEHEIALRIDRVDGPTYVERIPVVARDGKPAPGAQPEEDPDLKLHLDAPRLVGGEVETPLRGNLEISGWALASAGVAAIEIAIDDKPVALADYGLRRLDVRAALPEWDDALASGYQALVPHRILPKGSHTVSVTLRDKAGRKVSTRFGMEVEELSDLPGPWLLRRRMVQAEIDLYRHLLAGCSRPPEFVAVLPISSEEALRRTAITLTSLDAQVYPNWHLLIVPLGTQLQPSVLREWLLGEARATANRVEVVRSFDLDALAGARLDPGNLGGEVLFTVLSPGDELGVDAFLEMAVAVAMHEDADFFYSDERCVDPGSGAVAAYFKPQWSPDLMLSANYVGRLWCARSELLRTVAAPTEALLRHGEYDLVLRCTEAAKTIRHIPAVLCERAENGIDASQQEKTALRRTLARRGIAGEVRAGSVSGTWRVQRTLTKPGLVSIVIPTCAARGMIETCITTLRRVTAYRNYEIVCIENIPARDRKWRTWLRHHADRVTSTREGFNWARFSNLAAAEATGDYLLFLNDDIEVTEPDWLDALLEQAQRPEIGVVGPRLLYPDRRVQHAGMFLAAIGQARHAFRYAAADDPGYFGLAATTRNVIAVTGACLMTRRETFDALGGFDETQAIVNNDLDYALRARQLGLLTVYTPHATLIHHEAISRAALEDDYDAATFDSRWRDLFLAGDPYFSPHLSKNHDDFAIDDEPTQLLVTGRPTLRRDEIRKILVVKLDHIGDCIIAFPAVRRLKGLFPDARIAVLTSRASRPVWGLEASVDETIEFDFFHARSGLGELERSDEDWRELRQLLTREKFDLAVDLRKHTETRPALQHTGARYLAGFDFRNQFPWLDIALEWTGDQIYARKRQHNADDLVNLVDAIGAACERDRGVIAARPSGMPALALKALRRMTPSTGPLVCVHPTVGNDARQWPIEYFVAVIDRLVDADGARVVLIGAPGDEEVAATILARVRRKKAITSLVGKLPLAELPALLAEVSLFLGNNSGPKHIAAGLGVPTVGIHSGTEDVREWGPVGPSAIAVARDMVCSPCYLAHAADCPRGLACLRELEPARVYDACKRLLLLGPARPPPPIGGGAAVVNVPASEHPPGAQ